MNSRRHQTILIHGVTGSGKTEVYIQAIQEVIHFGRQAIVLVPEISLTPQTVERFRQRFGAVAVLHSHLSDAERHWHWQRIAEGAVSVVVGARSAIFAPTPNLGLIVLDEEHETSFKQESVPALSRPRRGHRPGGGRRDSAGARLGHAVAGELAPGADGPSTRWSRCRGGCWTGRCRRWARSTSAARRAGGAVARGHQPADATRPSTAALDEGGQVILLLNRRGFSTHIQCPACGHVVRCPECDIALTHHRTEEIALCHYCDYEVPAPTDLPGVRLRRHPLLGPGHAAAGGGGPRPIPQRAEPADGHRRHAGPRQPRAGAGGVSLGQGPHPAGHADDRQGAGFSQRHAGRRDQCRHGPAPARLPRRRTDVPVGHAGGGPDRPRAEGRPGAGADLQPRPSGHPGGGAARLRGVCGRRVAHPPDAPLPAVCRA